MFFELTLIFVLSTGVAESINSNKLNLEEAKDEYECTISCYESLIAGMMDQIESVDENLQRQWTQFCKICGDSDLTWDLGRITTEMLPSKERNHDEIVALQTCLRRASIAFIPLFIEYTDKQDDLMYCGAIKALSELLPPILGSQCKTTKETELKYTLIHTAYEKSIRMNTPYGSVLACFDERPIIVESTK